MGGRAWDGRESIGWEGDHVMGGRAWDGRESMGWVGEGDWAWNGIFEHNVPIPTHTPSSTSNNCL